MSYKTTSKSVTGVGQATILFQPRGEEMRALINCIVTGSVSYNIEYSLNGTDWVMLGQNTGVTVTSDATLVFPVAGVRANVVSGSGTVKLIVLSNGGGS